MRDIFSELISELDNDPADSATPTSHEDEASFILPEGAKPYLPARILDNLGQSETPRKGILLNALDRVRSVLYNISTYLPQHVVQQKMRRPIRGRIQGREIRGTLLFSDVSGFTALSERLAVLGNEGAERLTEIMNGYFENMLEILAWSGGVLLKFAGDATLVYFAEQNDDQQTQWAVRTGQRMMAAMSHFQNIETPLGEVGLKMKIGISTGRFLETHIGSAERMEYVVLGQTVRQTMGAEGAAEAGMVVVDEQTANHLTPESYSPHVPGYFVVRPTNEEALGDFEVKAESRRARSGIPWNANPHAIAAQMDVAVRQIESLTPYLASELVDNIAANARQRRIASEFRPTSVIFCNFIGFEGFLDEWGRHGPRRVATIMSQFFEAMHAIVNSHGGVVTRIDPYTNGSKMLVLFGAPIAHEDDPQRAVSAAIAMRAKVAELNKEWQQLHNRYQTERTTETADSQNQIQLKIGVTHGRSFAGQVGSATRREYTVMGDDVNLSARLMSAAKPGQILINEPVFRAVEDHFYAEPLQPIRVKGKSNPIPIFELREKRTVQSYQDEQQQKPIFGRQHELSAGQEAIQKAIQGHGRHLVIQGAAGIGKSHLASTFYAQAQEKTVEVRLTHCHSFTAQSPYAAWILLIRNLAAINETNNTESAGQKLADLLVRFDMNEEAYSRPFANLLGVRLPSPPEKSPLPTSNTTASPTKASGGSSLFSQLGQKVSSTEGKRETGLDLSKLTQKQTSTPSAQLWQRLQTQVAARERARLFTAVFQLLKQLAAQKPLLLFFENAQWLDPASRELLQFVGQKLADQPVLILSIQREAPIANEEQTDITLGPLSYTGTAEMVNHLMAQEMETAVIKAIHTQSGGNPLFIREMVYWLKRNGSKRDMTGSLKSSMTIQELILSRIDNLPLEARETLKLAAIIGNIFRAGELNTLLQKQKKEYILTNALQQLKAGQIIAQTAENEEPANDSQYAFQQPLIHEIIYNSQSFAKRRQSHRILAEYLEEKYADNIDQQVDLLAYHFEQAEQWRKAGRYRFLAAQKARQRYAYDLALSMFGQALAELTKVPPPDKEPETTTLMAQCHEGQGDMALLNNKMNSAAYAYLSAVNILSAAQQPAPADIQIKAALALSIIGKADEAETSIRLLLNQPLPSQYETVASAVLTWLLWRSEKEDLKTSLNRTKRLAARKPDDPWANGITALLIEWEGNLESALEAYQTFEQPAGILLTNIRLGDQSLGIGDFDSARDHYREARKTAEAQTDTYHESGLALAQYRLAELNWRTGHVETANEALHQALSLLPPWLTAERQTISQALTLIQANVPGPWPSWRWQSYDDAFRISLLFHE